MAKVCPNCQNKSKNAEYCIKCGSPMTDFASKKGKVKIFIVIGVVILGAAAIIAFFITIPLIRYNQAVSYFNDKRYVEAYAALERLSMDYRDVSILYPYFSAYASFERGEYEIAAQEFGTLDDYMDAVVMKNECFYLYANDLMSSGKYDEAYFIFGFLSGYKDSAEMLLEVRYLQADGIIESDGARARELFVELGDYKDSSVRLIDCDYYAAMNLFDAGEYSDAYSAFLDLGDYRDCQAMLLECRYRKGYDLLNEKDFAGAIERFEILGDYKDSFEMVLECHYRWGTVLLDKKDFSEAYEHFKLAGTHNDSQAMLYEVRYLYGVELFNDGDYIGALERFEAVGNYKDSVELAGIAKQRMCQQQTILINEWYNETQKNLGNYVKIVHTTHAESYYDNGELELHHVFPEYDPDLNGFSDNARDEYLYYHDGKLYFCRLCYVNSGDEIRLYFAGDTLIRWDDENGTSYDNASENSKWHEWEDYAQYGKRFSNLIFLVSYDNGTILADGDYTIQISAESEFYEFADKAVIAASLLEFYSYNEAFVRGLKIGSVIETPNGFETITQIKWYNDPWEYVEINNFWTISNGLYGWILANPSDAAALHVSRELLIVVPNTAVITDATNSPFAPVKLGSLRDLLAIYSNCRVNATIRDGYAVSIEKYYSP